MDRLESIRVIDSHTAGEPTRIIVDGGPDLGDGSLEVRVGRFRREFDHYRSAVVNEPRGSDVLVGGLIVEPQNPAATCGVIFFNNVGYLGMCGHGAIGLAVTLGRLGRIQPGRHVFETPVGLVSATLENENTVTIENVPSVRHRPPIALTLEDGQVIHGSLAWGGNLFFLIEDHGQDLELDRAAELTEYCWRVRRALERESITGPGGAQVDHIELLGPPREAGVNARNFVLCPGGAYDRSPCGTGTSAKVACLAAEGKLKAGEIWRQESITGTIFEASYRKENGQILPSIRGSAYITAESTLFINPDDPFAWGIRR